jgi:formate dehydrogenase major subunit/NADH-quinone oxidoreductase subunit G
VSEITLTIDGREIRAEKGRRLLAVALEHGIEIPHLCGVETSPLPYGACRLCWVQLEGRTDPSTACTVSVDEGMVVTTRTEKVDRLVKSAFDMLLSTHPLPCKGCPGHKRCALQDIARMRKLKLRHGAHPVILRDLPIDTSHPKMGLDPNRCILCGECIRVCDEHGIHALGFMERGLSMRIGTFGDTPLAETRCSGCGLCIEVCPVKALFEREETT